MPTGRAVTIGVGKVDPFKYPIALRDLPGSVTSARSMHALAQKAGLTVLGPPLLSEGATQDAVVKAIAAAAKVSKPGDFFFLAYAGHGRQLKDFDGDEDDKKDETWCLFDGELTDDKIGAALCGFDKGVRIFVTSDSCHSGTIISFLGKMQQFIVRTLRLPRRKARRANANRAARRKSAFVPFTTTISLDAAIAAEIDSRPIILLASSREDQDSATGTGDENSAFTAALLAVWRDGAFAKSYLEFHSEIKALVKDPAQTPQILPTKTAMKSFVKQRPFTI